MSGLLSDAGFIYQQKVVIYHILEAILRKELAECKIELTFSKNATRSKETYSLDFLITLNKKAILCYYEVKNRKKLHLKNQLVPVIENFYMTFCSNPKNCQFNLVHSSQMEGRLFKDLHYQSLRPMVIAKLLNKDKAKIIDFANTVNVKQMLDGKDANLTKDDLDLRSIAIIEAILKDCKIRKFGASDSVYQSLRTCYANLIQDKANLFKARLSSGNQSFPIIECARIKLNRLLTFPNSFVDRIMERDRLDSEEAIRYFNTKFNIPELPSLTVRS